MNRANKNNNIKKEESIQKESKSNEKNVSIGLSTKRRIKCEVCSKENAKFFCSQCNVHYCQNCESEVNDNFLKKKHEQFISQDTFVERRVKKESKEKNNINNRCPKHNQKLQFYCQEEDQLICREEMIKKIKKEKEKLNLSKEIFDPKMNYKNVIQLKNQNRTVWNPSEEFRGGILGQTRYSTGKHKIKIKIDQFVNTCTEENAIHLGVINTENREHFIKNEDFEGFYFFETNWDKNLLKSSKQKKKNGKWYSKKYPKNIKLKKNDILEILLDMDKKTIAFKINENNLGFAWKNLPESVHFFALLTWMNGNKKNQITLN
ncbi:spry domain containing socs box protein [Anaeramoeba flamelloides]|uniref:Spry domain containing socs box protein n=1 Tax=Anaeramoeba flamelloides TaxID=1746091 RepID=A0ABQ8X9K2_9EUKA|nr:spry domain containing socs box protein [Anaeramoeba flamelloides]